MSVSCISFSLSCFCKLTTPSDCPVSSPPLPLPSMALESEDELVEVLKLRTESSGELGTDRLSAPAPTLAVAEDGLRVLCSLPDSASDMNSRFPELSPPFALFFLKARLNELRIQLALWPVKVFSLDFFLFLLVSPQLETLFTDSVDNCRCWNLMEAIDKME